MTTQNERTTQQGNQAKHTPPPWVIDTDGEGKANAIVTSTHDTDGPDDDVCEVYGGNSDDPEVRAANARLIAAAPELLEALEKIYANAAESPEWIRAVLAPAIAKARGASQ